MMLELIGILLGVLLTGVGLIQYLEGFDTFTIKAPLTPHRRSVPSAESLGGGTLGKVRQTQTVITGLVIVITASLAVIVVDRFDESLGTPQSSELSSSQDQVLGGFSDMIGLIGPLLLVLIAVVIVGVVQRLRG
jgi:hypothetical protein